MKHKDTLFDRNIGVWSEDYQDRLQEVEIGIAGVGGAAHSAIDILLRNGVKRFRLADPDSFEIHNLQRQILATRKDLGRNKAEAVRDYILSVVPDAEVRVYNEGLNDENLGPFLDGLDYVIEALDISVLQLKRDLHQQARIRNVPSMTSPIVGCGAGLLVFFPVGMSFDEYFDFQHRGRLTTDRLTSKIPDYFQPNFFSRMQQGTVPTTCDGAYLTGVLTAGVIKRLIWGKPVAGAPIIHQIDMLDDQFYTQTHRDLGITPLYPYDVGTYLKLEGHSPTGSVKYRLARHLLEEAWLQGEVKTGQTVIEASSGNTGVALAMFAQKLGMKAEIYVPTDVDAHLVKRIESYGGTTHTYTETPMELAGVLQRRVQHENCYWPNQHTNPEALHSYDRLWQEMHNQFREASLSSIDYFFAALGTGGTLMSVGSAMRQHCHAQVVGVESDWNDPIPGVRNSDHQHFGAIDLFDRTLPDQIIRIPFTEAKEHVEALREQGIIATASTGACLAAAQKLKEEDETVVILSADGFLEDTH